MRPLLSMSGRVFLLRLSSKAEGRAKAQKDSCDTKQRHAGTAIGFYDDDFSRHRSSSKPNYWRGNETETLVNKAQKLIALTRAILLIRATVASPQMKAETLSGMRCQVRLTAPVGVRSGLRVQVQFGDRRWRPRRSCNAQPLA